MVFEEAIEDRLTFGSVGEKIIWIGSAIPQAAANVDACPARIFPGIPGVRGFCVLSLLEISFGDGDGPKFFWNLFAGIVEQVFPNQAIN